MAMTKCSSHTLDFTVVIRNRLTCSTTGLLQNKTMTSKNNVRVVDLRSDTVSKPTPEMRKAMAEAEVGDDVFQDDPTVNRLQQKAAALLGKESGLFVPSGTMGNLLAIMVHCKERGSEMFCGERSHTFLYEQAGPAQLAGVQIWPLRNNPDGTFDLDEMEEKVRDHSDDHEPRTSLIIAENTQNECGGKVLPLTWLDELAARAKKHNIPLHMDGARLFNAAVYLKVPASRIVRDFASATFCISKGLGAPVGAILVGSKEFICRARRLRKAVGGGMRQVGVLAAAGIIALDSMVNRLEEDHARAKDIAKAIADSGSKIFKVDYENLHTNILRVDVNHPKITAANFCDRMATVKEGEEKVIVKMCPMSKKVARLVTYYEITDGDIAAAIRKFQVVMKEFDKI